MRRQGFTRRCVEPRTALRRGWGVALKLLLLFLFASRVAADPPPLEAFGRLPAETRPAISPDGHWLAWIDQQETPARIVMFDVTNHRVHRSLAAPSAVNALVWSDADILLILLRTTAINTAPSHDAHTVYRFVALTAQEGPARFLPVAGKNGMALDAKLLHARGATPHSAIMYLSTCRCAVSVDTLTGEFTEISDSRPQTVGWVVDRKDTPLVREDWDFKTHTYRLLVQHDDSQKPRVLLRQSDTEVPKVMGATADGLAVVLLTDNGRAHQAAWALPLDGSPMQLLVEDPEADITNVFADPLTGAITGVYVSGSVTTLRWLDPAIVKRQEALQKLFPDRGVWQVGWTDDASKVLAQVQGPATAPAYYLVDYKSHRADIAAEEYPLLKYVELAPVRETPYTARDGTTIPAYLTRPQGATGPLPMVVLPHDGPANRDFPVFNWMVQYLASRGYAVLQPQFRGSSGFGDAWLRAGFRQWGGLMQDDVTDGVRAMVKLGIADPQHICLMGSNYGGYVALAGAAFTPDLYRCAVSVNGIADLSALVRDAKPKTYGTVTSNDLVIKERIGKSGDPNLARWSPINAAKNIHIPLLLLYGKGDSEELKNASVHMADVMRGAGKQVTLSEFETRFHMLSEIDEFLSTELR